MAEEILFRLPEWDREADVVIVGYGGAGAVAAITAHDEGARVLVLEKLPPDVEDQQGKVVEVRHTPNSRFSAALIYCPSNAQDAYIYQKKMNELYGIDDVPDDMLRAWAEMIVGNYDWLRALKGGEVFEMSETTAEATSGRIGGPEFPHFPGAKATRRIYNRSGGWGWFECLAQNVTDRGIEVLYSTPARDLVQNPNTREVVGVLVEHQGKQIAIKARRAVVLTCGGFEFNLEMQASYLRVWPFRFYGNPANTGDGVKMAQKVGADLWHMNNVVGRVTAWWQDSPYAFTSYPWNRSFAGSEEYRDGTSMPQYGPSYSFIIVDKYGKRFAKDIYKPHIFYWQVALFDTEKAEFPRIPCHMIFDEKTRREGPMGGCTGPTGPIKLYEWSPDNSREIAKGWIRKGNTLRELADAIGIPAGNLEETVGRWNQSCRDGKDEFGRDPSTLVPIDTPPYYELIQWPGGPNTLGGARRNKDAQVVDPDGVPIPRLYSSGEFGSIYGFLYEGGGNTAECIAFGRIAGRNAAAERPW